VGPLGLGRVGGPSSVCAVGRSGARCLPAALLIACLPALPAAADRLPLPGCVGLLCRVPGQRIDKLPGGGGEGALFLECVYLP
jgi:hypothetical protein